MKTIGTYVVLPVVGLYVAGLLDPVLASNGISMGRINFSFLAIARAVIAGSILFWLSRWSAEHGTPYIRAQENMRLPTRELAAKAFEFAIFAVVGLVL